MIDRFPCSGIKKHDKVFCIKHISGKENIQSLKKIIRGNATWSIDGDEFIIALEGDKRIGFLSYNCEDVTAQNMLEEGLLVEINVDIAYIIPKYRKMGISNLFILALSDILWDKIIALSKSQKKRKVTLMVTGDIQSNRGEQFFKDLIWHLEGFREMLKDYKKINLEIEHYT